jgi:hypothetical protein
MKDEKKLDAYYTVIVKYNSIVRGGAGPLKADDAHLGQSDRTLACKQRKGKS